MCENVVVYVFVDGNKRVLAVESSIFLTDLTGWIKIDEGIGDRYTLAQTNYFTQLVKNDDGTHNYVLEGSVVRACTEAELAAELVEIQANRPPIQPTADEVNSQAIAELSILQAQQSTQTNMAIAELSVLIGGVTNV